MTDPKIAQHMTLESFMVPHAQVIKLTTDMKIWQVAEQMIRHQISGMPIVDSMDNVISIIGEGDTLRLAAEFGLDAQISHCLPRLPNSTTLVMLKKQDKFTDAYAIFLKHKFHRIPIVDGNGALKGLVTRSMILRLFVEAHFGKKIPDKRGA